MKRYTGSKHNYISVNTADQDDELCSNLACQERLSKGIDAMVTIVIEGVQGYSGIMPPRGGNPNLNDEQIREAVQYMLDQLQ